MSRTYKTRPRWVKLNDPKFPTKESHQHYNIRRELNGKTETRIRHRWVGLPNLTEPEEYEVPAYDVWVENVECTLDVPEVPWQHWKYNKHKLCDRRPLFEKGCACCTRRREKSQTNQALRSKVKVELKKTLNYYGGTTDTDPMSHDVWLEGCGDEGSIQEFTTDRPNWWDVDIFPVSKYDSPYWWD